MQRKRRHYETLGFLLVQLGRIWATMLPLAALFVGIIWAVCPGEPLVIGWFNAYALAMVSSTSLIIVFLWLSGSHRRQARQRLIEKRRRAQGRRKLSLELGLPKLKKETPEPIESRSFQLALAEYLNSIFTITDVKETESAMSPLWLSPDLNLKKILPRSAERLRYLLERIRSLVHPASN